ncbi:MAG TPA: FkbM family methyltransferase [Patescibacteria group bacterium]|nr:FkbM family methyltransferase [Patescibacteria group bacterium]
MIKIIDDSTVNFKMDVETEFEEHRFKTLFSKEPETISWIKELFRPNEILFDVGANIGVYSLYAGALYKDKIKVYAFEPAYHNFQKLCQNILINQFNEDILPYGVALSGKTGFSIFDLVSDISGSANHAVLADQTPSVNGNLVLKQGVFTVTLDDLVNKFGFTCPNHFKLDVDGQEDEVIAGAREVLNNQQLKTAMIEVTDKNSLNKKIREIMFKAGFKTDHPINYQANHSRERRKKSGHGDIENIIFTR